MKKLLAVVVLLLCAANAEAEQLKPAAIYYTASWCHYCKQTTPIVRKLQREGYPIMVADIDTPQGRDYYRQTGAKVVPALQARGKVKQGAMNEQQLRAWLHANGVKPVQKPQPQAWGETRRPTNFLNPGLPVPR